VRPGGYIVLDDSDGAPYRGADQLLKGWAVKRFVGLKHFPLMAIETSIYRRQSAKTNDPEDAPGQQ
jgi:hypothetical protein